MIFGITPQIKELEDLVTTPAELESRVLYDCTKAILKAFKNWTDDYCTEASKEDEEDEDFSIWDSEAAMELAHASEVAKLVAEILRKKHWSVRVLSSKNLNNRKQGFKRIVVTWPKKLVRDEDSFIDTNPGI